MSKKHSCKFLYSGVVSLCLGFVICIYPGVCSSEENILGISLSTDKTEYDIGDTQLITVSISGEQQVDVYLALVQPNDSFACATLSDSGIRLGNDNYVDPVVLNWLSVPGIYPLEISLTGFSAGQYSWYCIFTSPGSSPLDPGNWLISSSQAFTIAPSESGSGDYDYSGTYYTRIGADPQMLLTISQTGSSLTWSTTGVIEMSGTGSVNNKVLAMSTTTPFAFAASLTFTGTTDFQGTWVITDPENGMDGTIVGSTNAWTTYDLDTLGIPQFVENDYIELSKIDRISYFRSGEGHDYSDDFESCRSMKHYYVYESNVDPTTIAITSPVTGKIVGLNNEWAGVQVGIVPMGYPGLTFIIFHVDLSSALDIGDTVTAGQTLGTHIGSQTNSDMAVGIMTLAGYRYVSYLETMSDSLFSSYQARGMSQRNDASHGSEIRDADPLTCNDEEFQSSGNLPGLFQFN